MNCSKQAPMKEVYDILLGQKNELEIIIADCNFAIDKKSSGTNIEEIKVLAFGQKEENDQYVNEVD